MSFLLPQTIAPPVPPNIRRYLLDPIRPRGLWTARPGSWKMAGKCQTTELSSLSVRSHSPTRAVNCDARKLQNGGKMSNSFKTKVSSLSFRSHLPTRTVNCDAESWKMAGKCKTMHQGSVVVICEINLAQAKMNSKKWRRNTSFIVQNSRR
jgi:hypothetical protein